MTNCGANTAKRGPVVGYPSNQDASGERRARVGSLKPASGPQTMPRPARSAQLLNRAPTRMTRAPFIGSVGGMTTISPSSVYSRVASGNNSHTARNCSSVNSGAVNVAGRKSSRWTAVCVAIANLPKRGCP